MSMWWTRYVTTHFSESDCMYSYVTANGQVCVATLGISARSIKNTLYASYRVKLQCYKEDLQELYFMSGCVCQAKNMTSLYLGRKYISQYT